MLVAIRRPLSLPRIWLVAFMSTTWRRSESSSDSAREDGSTRSPRAGDDGRHDRGDQPGPSRRVAGGDAWRPGGRDLRRRGGRPQDRGRRGAYQAILLIGLLVFAVSGARYLESTERTAFAQGHLVAELHRRIDHLFRQYVSPDVAEALVADPARAELGGEVVEVSVLFADLRGYTPFSEQASPEEVVAMLNSSFGAAVPAVFAEGGTIVQFVGDALMAIFNAPLRQPDRDPGMSRRARPPTSVACSPTPSISPGSASASTPDPLSSGTSEAPNSGTSQRSVIPRTWLPDSRRTRSRVRRHRPADLRAGAGDRRRPTAWRARLEGAVGPDGCL